MYERWQRAVFSESTEGTPPPRQDPPPPRQDPPRQDPPRQDPPRREPDPDPGPRRTPADQIAELRAEAAQYRIAARNAAEDRDQMRAERDAATGSLERTRQEAVAPLTAKLGKATQSIMDATIMSELVALGLQDTDLIGLGSKMPEAPKVALDDDFQVTGAKEYAAAFKKWKPQFFREAAPPPTGKEPPKAPPKTSSAKEPSGEGGDPPVVNVKDMDGPTYKAYKAAALRSVPRSM